MYHSGVLLATHHHEPNRYSVQELRGGGSIPKTSLSRDKTRCPIQVTIDAFTVSGWVDTFTFETMIEIEVCGIHLGVFHGVASQALQIDLDLQLVVGSLKLEMNAFDEIWVHVDTLPGEKGKAVDALDCKRSVMAQHLEVLPCEPWVPVK